MDLDCIAGLLEPFLTPIHNSSSLPCSNSVSANAPETQSPTTLSQLQLAAISTYINLLIRWNSRLNLTAIRDAEQIVTRHFGESLFAARHLFPSDCGTARVAPGLRPGDPDASEASDIPARHLLDIGSGAGFPALPIKIWAPQIRLTMVESNQKKATFLREVCRALTLTNINVLNSRAEEVSPATADTVTFRAVERFQAILPLAMRLTRPGGRLALLIGESQLQSATGGGLVEWISPIAVPQSNSRVLLIGTRLEVIE